MASKKNLNKDLGLKVTPEKMMEAVQVLDDYIQERIKLVADKKITEPVMAIKLMAAIQDFTEILAKRAKSPAEALYGTIRFTLIPTLFDENDLVSERVDGIGGCRLQDDISCKVTDTNALHKWLIKEGVEDIIKPTVNAQTLAAFFRGRMKENAEIVNKAMKAGTTDPVKLQSLQLAMPAASIVEIKPVVRAQLTRE